MRIIGHGCYQCHLGDLLAVLEKKEGRVRHAPATDSPTSCGWVGDACAMKNQVLAGNLNETAKWANMPKRKLTTLLRRQRLNF